MHIRGFNSTGYPNEEILESGFYKLCRIIEQQKLFDEMIKVSQIKLF